jgi:hypothetical protein
MGLIITITFGFGLWLVLWAIGWKADDSGMLALAIILIVVASKIAIGHMSPKRSGS